MADRKRNRSSLTWIQVYWGHVRLGKPSVVGELHNAHVGEDGVKLLRE